MKLNLCLLSIARFAIRTCRANLKQLVLLTLGALLPFQASTQTFSYKYENVTLKYDKGGDEVFILEGTYMEDDEGSTWYESQQGSLSGANVVIPAEVEYEGTKYPVMYIEQAAFVNCRMKSVSIPATVESIGRGAFSGCTSLTKVTFESVEALCKTGFTPSNDGYLLVAGTSNPLYYAGHLFIGDEEVFEVTVPSGIKSLSCTFAGGKYLTSINLPDGFTTIGEYLFYGCSALESLKIPETVKYIKKGSFNYCNSLKSITFPPSISQIESGWAYGLNALNSVYYLTDTPQKMTWGTGFNYEKPTLYLTEEGKKYVEANKVQPWINFKNIEVFVGVESVSLSESSKTLGVNDEFNLTVSFSPENASNQAVKWSSSDEEVAKVDDNGKVTAIAVGEAIITATSESNPDANAECVVTVEIPVESISLDQETATITKGEKIKLTAIINPEEATNKTISWTSSNEEVAIVDQYGEVTTIAAGKAAITATAANGKSASCEVTVIIPVNGLNLSETEATIEKGANITLTAKIEPEDATETDLTWTSSNEKVATVDEKGEITALSAGSTIITATTTNGLTASCELTVIVPVSGLILNESEASIEIGKSITLSATVEPDDATEIKLIWSSSNEEVATVDEEGVVTAVAVGEAIITVTAHNGISASCVVTVKPIVAEDITLNHTSLELIEGDTEILTVTVAPENTTDKTVTWISSDNEVATVDDNGRVTAIAEGTSIITAACGEVKAECTVTVVKKIIEAEGITLSSDSEELTVGESVELTVTVTPDDTNDKTVTWISSNDEIATVDDNGKVTAVSEGTATITATCGDVKAECTVIVTALTTGISRVYGDNNALNIINGVIMTEGAAKVYTLDGKLVADSEGGIIKSLSGGIYIVVTNGAIFKVIL
ncbi:MAG: Ig-like domain-containing protein [Duncaniella sp.]|nr:Ig-like domain-containing protein [Duncaniella sp.]